MPKTPHFCPPRRRATPPRRGKRSSTPSALEDTSRLKSHDSVKYCCYFCDLKKPGEILINLLSGSPITDSQDDLGAAPALARRKTLPPITASQRCKTAICCLHICFLLQPLPQRLSFEPKIIGRSLRSETERQLAWNRNIIAIH